MKPISWIIPCGILALLLAAGGICIAKWRDEGL